jgi:hypothetical protein
MLYLSRTVRDNTRLPHFGRRMHRRNPVNELIERLQSKAGLSPEQAQKAAGVVAEFLETRLDSDQLQAFAAKVPGLGQFADRIPDNVGDQLGGMARGLFGKKD